MAPRFAVPREVPRAMEGLACPGLGSVRKGGRPGDLHLRCAAVYSRSARASQAYRKHISYLVDQALRVRVLPRNPRGEFRSAFGSKALSSFNLIAFSVGFGVWTSIPLRLKRLQRLGLPQHDKCREQAQSAFLVIFDIIVDEAGDIVIVLLLFLKERVVVSGLILDLDIIVDGRGNLVVRGLGIFEGDEFGGIDVRILLLFGDGGTLRPRELERLEDRAALRTDDRGFVEIEKFRAAMLALVFVAELGFRHSFDL